MDITKEASKLKDLIAKADTVVNLAAICNPSEYIKQPVNTIRSNYNDAQARAHLRHTQRSDATDVRIALEHCLAPKKLDAFKSVLQAALLEFVQSLQLGVVARHDQFTADLMCNVGLAAKLDHLPDAPHC